MRTLWRSSVGILNMYNVPPQGQAIAKANATAVLDQDPELVAFSEAWHEATRAGIYAAAEPRYRFRGVPGDSSFLGWDNRAWELVDEGFIVLHGAIASKVFGVVSDKRHMQWVLLRHRASDRLVFFCAGHVAPPATKRGRLAQQLAAAARTLAFYRVHRFIRRRRLPVMVAMDWNAQGPVLDDDKVGRRTSMSNPRSIDRLETADGRNGVQLAPALGRRVDAPHIDHPGGKFVPVYAYREDAA